MGFTSIDDFVSEVTTGKFWRQDFEKLYAGGTAVAGNWYDLQQGNGIPCQYLHGNMVTNYDFVTHQAPWTVGTTNWAYTPATHLMTRTANADVSTLTQNTKCVSGCYYMVTYALGWTAGTFTISLGGTSGTARGSAATFREIIQCGATANAPITITPNAAGAGTVDLVSVQPLAGVFSPYNDLQEGAMWHGGDVSPDTKHLVNFGAWTNLAAAVPCVVSLVDVLGSYPRIKADSASYQVLAGSDSYTRALIDPPYNTPTTLAAYTQGTADTTCSVVSKATEGVTGGSTQTNTCKMVVGAGLAAGGIICYKTVALATNSLDYQYSKYAYVWLRSTVSTNAGDLTWCTDEHAALASSQDHNVPALTANTWTRVRLDVSADAITDKDVVITIGFKQPTDLGAFTLYADDTRWAMPDYTITNGTFTGASTGWTLPAGWAYRSNDIERTAGAGDTGAYQSGNLVQKCPYRVTYTVANRSAGSVTVSLGGTSGTAQNTNATFEEIIICGTTDYTIKFTADATFNGRIDDVICMPVMPRCDDATHTYANGTYGGGNRMYFVMDNALSQGAQASCAVGVGYTNQAGTENRQMGATVNMTASDVVAHLPHSGVGAGKYGPYLPLQSGDYGIQSVDNFRFSVAGATALSAVDLIVCRPIASIPITTNFVAAERDLMNQLPSLPRVRDGACLMFLYHAGAVITASAITGYADFVWG